MNDWLIHWHDAKQELPKQSGKYLICKVYDEQPLYITDMYYSTKYKAFNMRDCDIKDTSISVHYWTEIPTVNESLRASRKIVKDFVNKIKNTAELVNGESVVTMKNIDKIFEEY